MFTELMAALQWGHFVMGNPFGFKLRDLNSSPLGFPTNTKNPIPTSDE